VAQGDVQRDPPAQAVAEPVGRPMAVGAGVHEVVGGPGAVEVGEAGVVAVAGQVRCEDVPIEGEVVAEGSEAPARLGEPVEQDQRWGHLVIDRHRVPP
jgi:hypothetical protein